MPVLSRAAKSSIVLLVVVGGAAIITIPVMFVLRRGGGASEVERLPSELEVKPLLVPDDPAVWLTEVRKNHRVVLYDGSCQQKDQNGRPLAPGNDDWQRIIAAKTFGELSPEELMHYEALCQSEANAFERQRSSMTIDSARPETAVAAAQVSLAAATAVAKGQSLLDGSYLLLATGESPPKEIRSHPDLHLVSCFGGTRAGIDFTTWVVIDLRKYPGMAQALENYRVARRAQMRARLDVLVSRINALDEDQRRAMANDSKELIPGLRELRDEFIKLGGRFEGDSARSGNV